MNIAGQNKNALFIYGYWATGTRLKKGDGNMYIDRIKHARKRQEELKKLAERRELLRRKYEEFNEKKNSRND